MLHSLKMTSIVLLSLLLISVSSAYATETLAEVTASPRFSLAQFELGTNTAFQSGGYNSFSGIIRWIPEYRLNLQWSVGLDAGVTDFKYTDTTHSLVIEYAATVRYQINTWSLKAIVGAQSWTSGSYSTSFMVGPEIGYHFDQPLFQCLNQIFASYTPVLKSGSTIQEIAVGVGFNF